MALKADPSGTGLLVRSFAKDIRERFSALSKIIRSTLVDDDALGKEEGQPFTLNVERQAWRFRSDPEKIVAFQKWLEGEIEKILLPKGALGEAWTERYVRQAYVRGLARAYTEARRRDLVKLLKQTEKAFFAGARDEFVKSTFGRNLRQMALLSTRTFEGMRGISAQMASRLATILTNGLLGNLSAKDIAKEMTEHIKGLSETRALLIAQTEMVAAQAEGNLDAFAALGIEKVTAFVEWATAGDDRVCPSCEALEGVQFSIEEARGLIPKHPRCRCAWVPSTKPADHNRTRTMRRKVADAILAEREMEKGTKAERLRRAKKRSSWLGKERL